MKTCLVCYKSLLFEIGGTQDLCEEHKNASDWYVIGSRFISNLGRSPFFKRNGTQLLSHSCQLLLYQIVKVL